MDENTITTILISAATSFSTKAVEGPIQTFNDIWKGAFGYKIQYWAESKKYLAEQNYKKYISSIDEKVTKIKEDNLQEPQLSIVGPALEASKYYIEEEKIREMFANLIASSMDSTYNGLVQHSFVEIIKQLSPHDAKLFSSFIDSHALIDIRNENISGEGVYLFRNVYFSDSFPDIKFNTISLLNLEKQGLIKLVDDRFLSNNTLYDYYENSSLISLLRSQYDNNPSIFFDNKPGKIKIIKKMFFITELGKAFKEVCIKDSL